MPESVTGARQGELVAQVKTKEGSLSFSYSNTDFLANTIGHVMAVPTVHLPLLTLKSIFQNPPPELAQQLKDRYKDVPWKGDVLVRVGHSSIIGDLQRFFAGDSEVRGKPIFGIGKWKHIMDFATKFALLPNVIFTLLKTKLFRSDNYNPLTNVVTVFHPRLGVGMHELGHAEFFDQLPRGKREAYALAKLASVMVRGIPIFGSIPIITSFIEWQASSLAMRRFANDPERLRELKVMEPAFATYLMNDLLVLSLPFVLSSPLTAALVASKSYELPFGTEYMKQLSHFGWTAGIMAGAAAGHLLSRLPYPGRRQRFGYVFSGEAKPPQKAPTLADRQVLVGIARPMGVR